MTERDAEIVAIARGWLGTPYRHQCAARGTGTDCLGLIRGVWRELHGTEPQEVPPYTADWSEPQGQEVLWQAAMRYLDPRPDGPVLPGEVLLFRMRGMAVAKHLGIAAEKAGMPTFIHAYSGHGVVECPLSDPWARRIVARFAFPNEV